MRRGELVGLVGENGSGKSVLMQIVVGLLPRDGGAVEVPARLGYCPQVPLLWDKLTVAEHFQLFGDAYRLPAARAARSRDALLEELSFAKYLGYRVEELSGTRQKLNLALALLHDPELLLLDEPWRLSCHRPIPAAGAAWAPGPTCPGLALRGQRLTRALPSQMLQTCCSSAGMA